MDRDDRRPAGAPTTIESELEAVAIDVARAAAAHVRQRRPQLFGPEADTRTRAVSTKSTPTDPVTVADTETETLIRERLHHLRPDDAVLGEEAGGDRDVPSGIRWVVDPIDGTVNFMYGIPAYAVSVAAQRDGRSVAGAVVDVAREVTYSAAVGRGAFVHSAQGSVRLSTTPITDTRLALVASGFGYDAQRRRIQGELIAKLLPHVRDLRRVGAAALDLCMVAQGRVDAHFEHGLSPWDWAAGALIAQEAGAVVRIPPPESRSEDGYLTLAMAPGIAVEFERLIGDLGVPNQLP